MRTSPKIRGVSEDPDVATHPRTCLDMLWERTVQGDPAAFEAVYQELAPPVYGVCLRVLRDPALAQEAAQEALLQVWRQAPQVDLRVGSSILAWACTIAHRRAVDSVRANESRKRREAALCNDPTSSFAVAAVSETPALDGCRASEVEAALKNLGGALRQAIELAYYCGLTYRQVSQSLGIPEGTAKARIRRGLLQLRREMVPNVEQNIHLVTGRGGHGTRGLKSFGPGRP